MGCGVIIIHNDKILVCKRVKEGEWAFPGGKIEEDEFPIEAAKREILEEVGLTIKDLICIGESSSAKYSDFTYLAFLKKNVIITLKKDEITNYRWVTFKELNRIKDLLYRPSYISFMYLKELRDNTKLI